MKINCNTANIKMLASILNLRSTQCVYFLSYSYPKWRIKNLIASLTFLLIQSSLVNCLYSTIPLCCYAVLTFVIESGIIQPTCKKSICIKGSYRLIKKLIFLLCVTLLCLESKLAVSVCSSNFTSLILTIHLYFSLSE